MKYLLYGALFCCFFLSCKKEPGPGGIASVKGKVLTRYYDRQFRYFQYEHYSTETSVYIIYGDQEGYGDKTTTSNDGVFIFRYLQPGKYTVYVYSEDSTLSVPGNELVVQKEITISKGDKEVDAGVLTRVKTLDYNEGYASICGTITKVGDNVFIKFPDGSTDNVRSDEAGHYCFTRLLKGVYTVYWINSGITYSRTDTITGTYEQKIINFP